MHFFMAATGGVQDDNDHYDEGDTYDDDDDDDNIEMMDMLPPPPTIDGFNLEDGMESLTRDELLPMTITQLKQQLRLRGKRVTGNKSQLIERLLARDAPTDVTSSRTGGISNDTMRSGYTRYDKSIASRKNNSSKGGDEKKKPPNERGAMDDSRRVIEAKTRGADIVDVTDFVDAEEVGKSFRSNSKANSSPIIDVDVEDTTVEGSSETSSSSSEVWGEDARIVDDYEGRSIVVDGLSRTVIEYKGSSNSIVQAYAVGSRDSLKRFLRGGNTFSKGSDSETSSKDGPVYSSMEEEVYAIQRKREMESKRGLIGSYCQL